MSSSYDGSPPPSSLLSRPATPSSSIESAPMKVTLLLSPFFAEPRLLQVFADMLERGSGALALLCVKNAGKEAKESVDNGWLSSAMDKVLNVLSHDCSAPRRWITVENTPISPDVQYYVSCHRETEDGLEIGDCVNHSSLQSGPELTTAETLALFSNSSLRSVLAVDSPLGLYTLHALERPLVSFPVLAPSLPALKQTPFGVPTLEEWNRLWAVWDLVTLRMIPSQMLHQKPIDLRHKCLFYIGHIPTFLDMLLSKALNEPNTDPKKFTEIFERGIDPHVDDPDHCHSHSEVPDNDEDWPILDSILAFRDRVRSRLVKLYEDVQSGKRVMTRNLARTLVMTLEHEGFHVETLLYMLIQRAGTGTLPPPGFTTPPWSILASRWDATPPTATLTVTLGPATVILGHQDSESDDSREDVMYGISGHEFGWDNESPPRAVEVGKFAVDWRPVTNGQFYEFWKSDARVQMPKSWVTEEGAVKVRTLYGPVPLGIARHWPVLTTYDDMSVYARSKGGRIPTEAELRLFFDKYEIGHAGGANVGFRNWHPVAATAGLEQHGGRGSNGGVWEWTSDEFKGHDGLVPTDLFTGYSTDFFDGKHQAVLGASYATIPRLAERRTVRNFYQRNYPYPWVGARVAYNL